VAEFLLAARHHNGDARRAAGAAGRTVDAAGPENGRIAHDSVLAVIPGPEHDVADAVNRWIVGMPHIQRLVGGRENLDPGGDQPARVRGRDGQADLLRIDQEIEDAAEADVTDDRAEI